MSAVDIIDGRGYILNVEFGGGKDGIDGKDGVDGVGPNLKIGTVEESTTGEPEVTITNEGSNTLALNFKLVEGEKGDKGDTGDTGLQGIQGIQGETGETGPQGEQGVQGIQGIQGEQGVQGIQGEIGITGATGAVGAKGDTGEGFSIYKTYSSVANMEADLANVPEGKFVMIASDVETDEDNSKLYLRATSSFSFVNDLSGATGVKGDKGEKGDKGDTGLTGSQGAQGVQGVQGAQGEQGLKGDKGDTGLAGAAATIEVGTVVSGTSASVTNSGDETNATFDFVIPKGDDGNAATITVGNVTSGTEASVTNTGTENDAVFDFVIPKGDDGVGMDSITQTTTSTKDGGINKITATLSDGTSSVFNVQNGNTGQTGNGIASIEYTQGDSNIANITKITMTDSTVYTFNSTNGADGSDGNSITGITMDNDGNITFTLSDNTSYVVGSAKGDSGVGIDSIITTTSANDNAYNTVRITLTDGSYKDFQVKNGSTGAAGKSAYEIAVDNGYVGTEQAWIASLKGSDGTPGTDGTSGSDGDSITIDSSSITYQASESNTITPTGVWSSTIPAVAAGSYLWSKTIVNYRNTTSSNTWQVVTYGVSRNGINGTNGIDGTDGSNGANGTSVTITSNTVTYQIGISGSIIPSGTWTAAIPSDISQGDYLWTKCYVLFSNNLSTTWYSCSGVSKVTIGSTITGAAGTNASVSSVVDGLNNTLTFTIPQGAQGPQGIQGIQGIQGEQGPDGTLTTTSSASLDTATNESLANSVSLHKISKTGLYSDLVNKPTTFDGIEVLHVGTGKEGFQASADAIEDVEPTTNHFLVNFVFDAHTYLQLYQGTYGLDNIGYLKAGELGVDGSVYVRAKNYNEDDTTYGVLGHLAFDNDALCAGFPVGSTTTTTNVYYGDFAKMNNKSLSQIEASTYKSSRVKLKAEDSIYKCVLTISTLGPNSKDIISFVSNKITYYLVFCSGDADLYENFIDYSNIESVKITNSDGEDSGFSLIIFPEEPLYADNYGLYRYTRNLFKDKMSSTYDYYDTTVGNESFLGKVLSTVVRNNYNYNGYRIKYPLNYKTICDSNNNNPGVSVEYKLDGDDGYFLINNRLSIGNSETNTFDFCVGAKSIIETVEFTKIQQFAKTTTA